MIEADSNSLIFIAGVAVLILKTFHDHKQICARLSIIEDHLGIGRPKSRKV